MDLSFTLAVIFTGIVIVFIVLIILIAFMMLMGKLLGNSKQPSNPDQPGSKSSKSPSAPAKNAPMAIQTNGIAAETVAVIAAAIAAFTQGAGRIVSIRPARSKGALSPWAAAGLRENTQPF